LSYLILLRDFNAHHPLWGYSRVDTSGAVLSDMLEEADLVIVNSKIPTVYLYTGESGMLDLTVLSPSLALKAKYQRLSDPMSSDHYQIVVNFNIPSLASTRTDVKWKFKRANWPLYQNEIDRRCSASLFVHQDVDKTYKEKADAFGAHFAAVSSDVGYEEPFLSVKRFMDYAMKPLFDKTDREGNSDALNCAVTFSDLKAALAAVRPNTSPGSDCIPYTLLKNIPPSALHLLLKFYNSIWLNGLYPKYWRVSLVIPVLKQGKDRSDLNSYRPISLSNCMGKLLEKIVNKKLIWHLENKKILSKAQSGFRQRMSTEHHVACLQDLINKVLAVKQHLVAVFIDSTKAFDRVWRTGLFIRLRAIGVRGNMFKYLRNISSHTFLRVKLEGVLSRLYQICNGILEGSVISPTLFILLVDAITGLIRDITLLFFADDTTLVKADANVNYVIEKL
jgi:hypothetical protein